MKTMNKYATQKAKTIYRQQIDPEASEYECFFHHTDEGLFLAGFEQALNYLVGAGIHEIAKLTAIDETTYNELTKESFTKWYKGMQR